MALPFLTLTDPKTTGEGVLDPLGLSLVADQLADEILPGLRARMVRPRFLTALAVSAAVYEGIEDQLASDGVTPAPRAPRRGAAPGSTPSCPCCRACRRSASNCFIGPPCWSAPVARRGCG